jgi:hypothetical protein
MVKKSARSRVNKNPGSFTHTEKSAMGIKISLWLETIGVFLAFFVFVMLGTNLGLSSRC